MEEKGNNSCFQSKSIKNMYSLGTGRKKNLKQQQIIVRYTLFQNKCRGEYQLPSPVVDFKAKYID